MDGVILVLPTTKQPRLKIQDIQNEAVRHFGIERERLFSRTRTQDVVWPRQVAMYYARKMTGRSLPSLGRYFGHADHTSVFHAVRKVEGVLRSDPYFSDVQNPRKRTRLIKNRQQIITFGESLQVFAQH